MILFVYERAHQGLESRCAAGKTAMTWLFGTFTCFFISMCLEGVILRQSLLGTILQPAQRKHINTLLYCHFVITIADVCFTALGTLLDYHVGNSCYVRNHVHTAIVVVIGTDGPFPITTFRLPNRPDYSSLFTHTMEYSIPFPIPDTRHERLTLSFFLSVGNYFIIACNFLGVALIFSVFAHLPSEERWNRMFGILGCCLCMPRSTNREYDNQGTLSQIATCFGEVFQGADLVPSDIAAGLALLALQHRGQLEGEPIGWPVTEGSGKRGLRQAASGGKHKARTKSNGNGGSITEPLLGGDDVASIEPTLDSNDNSDDDNTAVTLGEPMSPEALSDMLAEAAHYARWALAAYGWMLYTWANPTGGLALACSARGLRECCCCCCPAEAKGQQEGMRIDPESGLPEGGTRAPVESLDREALKTCAGIKGEDLFYVSFTNGVGEQPYFIARDVSRKAIVVSVRGTMSVQDCITDSMYKPVLLDGHTIGMPHLRGKQLHCHAGVVTATNFILSDLERHRILHQVLLGEAVAGDTAGPSGTFAEERKTAGDQRLTNAQAKGHQGWSLVICGHSLGAGVATVLSLHLRASFPDVRVWGIEPPGGLMSAELAKACGEWTVSSIHNNDLIARLSGPCLLKLRQDLVDALTRCKVSKFSLLARVTLGAKDLEESDVLLPPGGQGADEASALRTAFLEFHNRQVTERPLMAAQLYPPGRLLHLRRLPLGRKKPSSLAEAYEGTRCVSQIQAHCLMPLCDYTGQKKEVYY